ncbi:hypothetical protein MSMTP_2673 [Methanosarcina sp. MTP4]|uniref:hypothetical protein n=1 Tax=Methanosarcina sp. MTP4 TaxID=1434100 RepID=UPI000615635B|nr:hypothetical protein [Methanosarcina sp. MTP4]AKB26142.1 hypothetical protein MSMTP_2673 [Methanosarcina sp. MTP4]
MHSTSEEPGLLAKIASVTIVPIIICAIFIALDNGECIFAEYISNESEFQVNLSKNTKYELWVVDLIGPEKINISVRKDSYVAYEDTFMLMHPEGDYLPYHPDFTVKENGTYKVHIKPQDPGTVKIGILEYPSKNGGIIKEKSEQKKEVKLLTPSKLKEELGI